MPELWEGKVPIIRRSLNEGWLGDPEPVRDGAIERDYEIDPPSMGDSPASMQVISDPQEQIERWKEQHANKSSLFHMYFRDDKPAFKLLDQNGHGYCWAYSTGHCVMFDRLKQNLPMVRINPHATAAIIKRGRDEGGWSGLSLKFGREHGYAVEGDGPGEWPLHSRNLKYDTPELRANMALHKATEDWYDFGKREFDQTLNKNQLITCWLQNHCVAADYNRFSHAMAFPWCVLIDGRFHPMKFASWKNYGYYGWAILYDMYPNNAVALRATTPSDR